MLLSPPDTSNLTIQGDSEGKMFLLYGHYYTDFEIALEF